MKEIEVIFLLCCFSLVCREQLLPAKMEVLLYFFLAFYFLNLLNLEK